MQGTMKLRSGCGLRKSVASGPPELFKARKMTKDGRNEHTSDYLSVGIERRIGKIVWVRRAWMQRECGWSFDEFKVGKDSEVGEGKAVTFDGGRRGDWAGHWSSDK
jgi:hypothetical protein